MSKKRYKYFIIIIVVLGYVLHTIQNRNYVFNDYMLNQGSLFISYGFWDCIEITDLEDKEKILQYCKEIKICKSIEEPSYLIGGERQNNDGHLTLKYGEERYDIRLPFGRNQLEERYEYKEEPFVVVDVYENNPDLYSRIRREYCTLSLEGYIYLHESLIRYSR